MLEMLKNLNPLILDVIVVSILVLIAFFGIIKGMKKTLITFVIASISLFLGFSPYTNSLKGVLAGKIFVIKNWTPAGSSNVFTFSATLFTNFLTSLALFLLFFLILTVIKILISNLLKRKFKGELKNKSKIGRIFAGLFSLVYQGALLIVLLLVMNTNIVGMKTTINNSSVTKFIVTTTEKILNKKDENLTTKVVIKVLNGNVLFKTSDNLVESYKYTDAKIDQVLNDKKYLEVLDDTTLSEEEAKKIIKDRLIDLSNMAVISASFDDNNVEITNLFSKITEEWLALMNRKVNENGFSKIEFTINEKGIIKLNLKNAGVSDDKIAWFDEITIEK